MNLEAKGDRYYGSDLNRFVDENCSRTMTAMNIDLIMHKKSKGAIRIIESKHGAEGMKKGQRDLLNLLGKHSELIGAALGGKFEVYIIVGDPPYNKATIINLLNDAQAEVDKMALIKFLNFEMGFEEL